MIDERPATPPPHRDRDRTPHSPEDARSGVLQHEVLVRELLSVDALAPGPVVVREVAALAHESGYDPVEGRARETESLLACVFFSVRSFVPLRRRRHVACRRGRTCAEVTLWAGGVVCV